MSKYSTEEVMNFYKKIKDREMANSKFSVWDFVRIKNVFTQTGCIDGGLGVIYCQRTGDHPLTNKSFHVLAYDNNSQKYRLFGFDESEINHAKTSNLSDCISLMVATREYFSRNDKSLFLRLLLDKENEERIDRHRYYRLDLDKLSKNYNTESSLLKAIFEEKLIILSGESIKRHSLEEYVIR